MRCGISTITSDQCNLRAQKRHTLKFPIISDNCPLVYSVKHKTVFFPFLPWSPQKRRAQYSPLSIVGSKQRFLGPTFGLSPCATGTLASRGMPLMLFTQVLEIRLCSSFTSNVRLNQLTRAPTIVLLPQQNHASNLLEPRAKC